MCCHDNRWPVFAQCITDKGCGVCMGGGALYLQWVTLYDEGWDIEGGGVCLAWGLLRDSVVYHQAPLRQEKLEGGWYGGESGLQT